jgi:7-keto-8-aminopelargonate synthetase-like enzyme
MLRPTIGMIPIERVAARIGERMKRMMIDATIIVRPLISIETLVLRVSWTTAVSELSLETTIDLVAF